MNNRDLQPQPPEESGSERPAGDEQLLQQLWDLAYGLCEPEEAEALVARICSDPVVARQYADVRLQSEQLAAAARLEAPLMDFDVLTEASSSGRREAISASGSHRLVEAARSAGKSDIHGSGSGAPTGESFGWRSRWSQGAWAAAAGLLLCLGIAPRLLQTPVDATAMARQFPQLEAFGPSAATLGEGVTYAVAAVTIEGDPVENLNLSYELIRDTRTDVAEDRVSEDRAAAVRSVRTDERGEARIELNSNELSAATALQIHAGDTPALKIPIPRFRQPSGFDERLESAAQRESASLMLRGGMAGTPAARESAPAEASSAADPKKLVARALNEPGFGVAGPGEGVVEPKPGDPMRPGRQGGRASEVADAHSTPQPAAAAADESQPSVSAQVEFYRRSYAPSDRNISADLQVRGPDGLPLPQARVVARLDSAGQREFVLVGKTDDNGAFPIRVRDWAAAGETGELTVSVVHGANRVVKRQAVPIEPLPEWTVTMLPEGGRRVSGVAQNLYFAFQGAASDDAPGPPRNELSQVDGSRLAVAESSRGESLRAAEFGAAAPSGGAGAAGGAVSQSNAASMARSPNVLSIESPESFSTERFLTKRRSPGRLVAALVRRHEAPRGGDFQSGAQPPAAEPADELHEIDLSWGVGRVRLPARQEFADEWVLRLESLDASGNVNGRRFYPLPAATPAPTPGVAIDAGDGVLDAGEPLMCRVSSPVARTVLIVASAGSDISRQLRATLPAGDARELSLGNALARRGVVQWNVLDAETHELLGARLLYQLGPPQADAPYEALQNWLPADASAPQRQLAAALDLAAVEGRELESAEREALSRLLGVLGRADSGVRPIVTENRHTALASWRSAVTHASEAVHRRQRRMSQIGLLLAGIAAFVALGAAAAQRARWRQWSPVLAAALLTSGLCWQWLDTLPSGASGAAGQQVAQAGGVDEPGDTSIDKSIKTESLAEEGETALLENAIVDNAIVDNAADTISEPDSPASGAEEFAGGELARNFHRMGKSRGDDAAPPSSDGFGAANGPPDEAMLPAEPGALSPPAPSASPLAPSASPLANRNRGERLGQADPAAERDAKQPSPRGALASRAAAPPAPPAASAALESPETLVAPPAGGRPAPLKSRDSLGGLAGAGLGEELSLNLGSPVEFERQGQQVELRLAAARRQSAQDLSESQSEKPGADRPLGAIAPTDMRFRKQREIEPQSEPGRDSLWSWLGGPQTPSASNTAAASPSVRHRPPQETPPPDSQRTEASRRSEKSQVAGKKETADENAANGAVSDGAVDNVVRTAQYPRIRSRAFLLREPLEFEFITREERSLDKDAVKGGDLKSGDLKSGDKEIEEAARSVNLVEELSAGAYVELEVYPSLESQREAAARSIAEWRGAVDPVSRAALAILSERTLRDMEQSATADADFVARAKAFLREPLARLSASDTNADEWSTFDQAQRTRRKLSQRYETRSDETRSLPVGEASSLSDDAAPGKLQLFSDDMQQLADLHRQRDAWGGFGDPWKTLDALAVIERHARRTRHDDSSSPDVIRWSLNGVELPAISLHNGARRPLIARAPVPPGVRSLQVAVSRNLRAPATPILIRLCDRATEAPSQPPHGSLTTRLSHSHAKVGETFVLEAELQDGVLQDGVLRDELPGNAHASSDRGDAEWVLRLGLPRGAVVDNDALRQLAEQGAIGMWQQIDHELNLQWLRPEKPLAIPLTAVNSGVATGPPSRCQRHGDADTIWWAPGLKLAVIPQS